jgi:Transposase DDE domain
MDTIAQVATAMREILTTTANTLARRSGFVQRTSKLTGAGFVQAWVFACMASPMPTWEDVSQSAATIGIAITAQGLEERCGESAATLLKEVLHASIQQVIATEPVAIPLLNRFPSVFIEDSSTIVLPPVLADAWQGCGGTTTHGNAALKVQVRLDLCCGTLRGPALQDGRAADQRSPLHTEPIVAKALYLADLGYWSLARFGRIASAGGFWLSRYQPQTALFTADGQRWDDVRRLLEAQGADHVDLPVTVGVDARVPARVLGVRLPPAVAEQRRQRLITEARAVGKPVSSELLHLAAWTIFLTNAPVAILSLREAVVIGRARWQIELLFKLWKSHGHVDESRGTQPWRVLCEVYAKLLAVLISHWVMLTELWAYPERSLVKAARLIQKHAFHLASSLWAQCALEDALNVIRDGLRACCRMNTRQKHPNTYQVLMNPELICLA